MHVFLKRRMLKFRMRVFAFKVFLFIIVHIFSILKKNIQRKHIYYIYIKEKN